MSARARRSRTIAWILFPLVVSAAGCDISFFDPVSCPNCRSSGSQYHYTALTVDPGDVDVPWGETLHLTASYSDSDGVSQDDVAATWGTSDPDVATVDEGGRVTGVGLGWAIITGRYEGTTGSAEIRVVLGNREWPGEMHLAELSTAWSHACGVEADGSLHCWGNNDFGQLALGDRDRGSMVPVEAPDVPALVRLGAGTAHTCGLTDAGAAYCWGENTHGSVGDGTMNDRATPTPVAGELTFTTLSAGRGYTCGLDPDGDALCWGANGAGQLGTGDTNPSLTPAAVAGEMTFRSLAAGLERTCALTAAGEAYCWGSFPEDSNTGAVHPTPEPVATDHRFAALDVAWDRICGIEDDGALWCWGRDPQTSQTWSEPRLMALDVPLLPETLSMHAEGAHGCALDADGAAWCWGINSWGQLGDGTGEDAAAPVPVAGDLRFQAVTAGVGFTCGLTTDHVAYCWGDNSHGQLGTGDVTWSPTPRRVVGQP